MKKSPAGESTRKPPLPSDSHDDIDDWMRRVMPDLHPIVARVDALIRETIPDAQYAVKWKKAHYGRPEQGWIIELVAYDVSVNVVFFAGAELEPEPPMGSGRSRYIKLTSLDEVDRPELRTWIEQAGRVAGWQAASA